MTMIQMNNCLNYDSSDDYDGLCMIRFLGLI
jgi:hypothetical protein